MAESLLRASGAAGAAVALLLLAACARPVGDFGRAEPSLVNDAAMPAIGALRAVAVGQPVSSFNQTDEEIEMQDRIWRFLNSGRTKDWFLDVAAELRRTRIAAGPGATFGVDRYYNWLHSTPYQSAQVRYATVGDDAGDDVSALPDAFAAICKVEAIDHQREVAAANLPSLGPASREDVAAREAENEDQITWFTHAVRYRYDSYNYALDHLLVETPHAQARAVDAVLAQLQVKVGEAEAGRFCDTARGHVGNPHPAGIIRSRVLVGGPTPVANRPAQGG